MKVESGRGSRKRKNAGERLGERRLLNREEKKGKEKERRAQNLLDKSQMLCLTGGHGGSHDGFKS